MTNRPNQNILPLSIDKVVKSFGENRALNGISLSLEPGNILALLGPSGCGKTTLLRCIAGLLPIDSGDVQIGGQLMNAAGLYRPPEARELGMVFQDYALWPHMTVAENVAFPLQMRGIGKAERSQKVKWALTTVGLIEFADRSPDTLSGGQQQRVAMARAIVAEPKLLLMDEPLSNLDKGLRETLAVDIRQLIKELGLSAVFVTHDQHEAFAMADQIAVLQNGELHQIATPQALYDFPANAGIARFLDSGLLIQGEFTEHGFLCRDDDTLLPFEVTTRFHGNAELLIPRRAIQLNGQQTDGMARVQQVVFQGEFYALHLALTPSHTLVIRHNESHKAGSDLAVEIDPHYLRAWSEKGETLAIRRLAKNLSPVRAVIK